MALIVVFEMDDELTALTVVKLGIVGPTNPHFIDPIEPPPEDPDETARV